MERSIGERSGLMGIFIGNPQRANPSRVDVVEDEVLKGASVWNFPNSWVTGRGGGHPKCGAVLT